MKIFISFFSFLVFSASVFSAEQLVKINFAYPTSGTVIGGQIGLILEKTDIFKIYGFEASIKRLKSDGELQKALVTGAADVIITTESNYVALTEKNANVIAFSTLGLEKDFQLVNVINRNYQQKNTKATDKLNAALVDAFYYLTNHKAEVNKWYASISKLTPKNIDTISRTNKNYNSKKLSEINIQIIP